MTKQDAQEALEYVEMVFNNLCRMCHVKDTDFEESPCMKFNILHKAVDSLPKEFAKRRML